MRQKENKRRHEKGDPWIQKHERRSCCVPGAGRMKARLPLVWGEWQGREPAAADGQQEAGAGDKAFQLLL